MDNGINTQEARDKKYLISNNDNNFFQNQCEMVGKIETASEPTCQQMT